jgi:hypothetical protein
MFLFVMYRYVVSNKYPKMNCFHLFSSVFYVLVCLMKTWMDINGYKWYHYDPLCTFVFWIHGGRVNVLWGSWWVHGWACFPTTFKKAHTFKLT